LAYKIWLRKLGLQNLIVDYKIWLTKVGSENSDCKVYLLMDYKGWLTKFGSENSDYKVYSTKVGHRLQILLMGYKSQT
jgi:hypothetical protein